MKDFIKLYVKSMRLYYSFITGIAGWIGLSFYEYIAVSFPGVEAPPVWWRKFLILVMLFLSWGINQIINVTNIAFNWKNVSNSPFVKFLHFKPTKDY